MDSLFSFDDNDVDEKSYFEKSEDGVNLKKKGTYNVQQASIYPQLHYQV